MATAALRALPKRRLFHSGKKLKHPHGTRPCANGCVGPFVRRPEMDAWLMDLARQAGIPVETVEPQHQCQTCGTDRAFSARELKGAA